MMVPLPVPYHCLSSAVLEQLTSGSHFFISTAASTSVHRVSDLRVEIEEIRGRMLSGIVRSFHVSSCGQFVIPVWYLMT